VDGLKGVNIDKKVDSSVCGWYNGDCLLNVFNSLPNIERLNINALRIPIFDKYKEKGDTILFGKVVSGAIKENYSAVIMPKGQEVTITKIFDNQDENLALAEAGDNIKIQLKGGADIEDIRRGNMICGVQFKCYAC